MSTEIVKYKSGDESIELSPSIIRQYLVAGNGNVTDQEAMMFIKLCQFQGLNPFLREAYLVKYSDNSPATMITGKETFVKRAVRNPIYKGHRVGISDDGKTAWAEVYKKGFEFPIRVEVDFEEYVGLKDGKPNRMWASKPKTMLKKVALCQALRESFPEDYKGMYSPEEISEVEIDKLPDDEVIIDGQAKIAEYDEHGTKQAQKKSQLTETKKIKEKTEKKVEKSEAPHETPKREIKTDEKFIKVAKVNKVEKTGKKTMYWIISQAETWFSTLSEKVAERAKSIMGTDKEALVLYNIAVVNGKEYYNVAQGEPEEVFIIQD
jgi:phage recombination protein Bet